ncbi:hypothetical protein [Thioclava kandeliae]|uniref:Uncharacterized protein n=1 Tax=Thioclava kandeliae TaxID=3070818 RepID=A0ABV1SJE9_9RHOB
MAKRKYQRKSKTVRFATEPAHRGRIRAIESALDYGTAGYDNREALEQKLVSYREDAARIEDMLQNTTGGPAIPPG